MSFDGKQIKKSNSIKSKNLLGRDETNSCNKYLLFFGIAYILLIIYIYINYNRKDETIIEEKQIKTSNIRNLKDSNSSYNNNILSQLYNFS